MGTFKEFQNLTMLKMTSSSGGRLDRWEYEFYVDAGKKFGLIGSEMDKLKEFLFNFTPEEIKKLGGYDKCQLTIDLNKYTTKKCLKETQCS